MARRFEDDLLVTVFEVDADEWLKEVQVRSGQTSNCPCDFCSPEIDDKLGRGRKVKRKEKAGRKINTISYNKRQNSRVRDKGRVQ